MISNVTNSTTADTSASTSSTSNITEVNGLFGKMFIENLGSGDATMVGYDYGPNNYQLPPGMTLADLNAAATNSPAASTPSSSSSSPSSSAAPSSPTPADVTASASVAQSAQVSTANLIPGVSNTDPNAVMNAQQVFGSSPWESDPTVSGPAGNFNLNPEYFATQQTAQMVAQMVGGTVVAVNNMASTTPGDVFKQSTDNEMVKLSDGSMINAGLVAGFFTHGYSLSMVQSMIQNEVTNVQAEDQAVQAQGVQAQASQTQGVITA